jgi:hypothetical protein
MTNAVGTLRIVRINLVTLAVRVRHLSSDLTLKMKGDLLSEPKFICFIFNRQHLVQKSQMTFLG